MEIGNDLAKCRLTCEGIYLSIYCTCPYYICDTVHHKCDFSCKLFTAVTVTFGLRASREIDFLPGFFFFVHVFFFSR